MLYKNTGVSSNTDTIIRSCYVSFIRVVTIDKVCVLLESLIVIAK